MKNGELAFKVAYKIVEEARSFARRDVRRYLRQLKKFISKSQAETRTQLVARAKASMKGKKATLANLCSFLQDMSDKAARKLPKVDKRVVADYLAAIIHVEMDDGDFRWFFNPAIGSPHFPLPRHSTPPGGT